MTCRKKRLGDHGEDIAARYLKKKGYRIIARNFRGRLGEIDIIAEQDSCLVFVEVKTRSAMGFGSPLESVTLQKQRQLSKVAMEYISGHDWHDRAARFDVVGIRLPEDGNYPDAAIELLQNAFDLCYDD